MSRVIKKSLTLIYFIFFPLLPFYAQTVSESLQFEERVFDFGEIKEEDGVVSHEFKFKNIGREVIFINAVTSGCGCVKFEFPKEPVRPNATGKVKVFYDPAYRPGFFSKEVVVLSNNNANYNRIWVKGTVIPAKHPVSESYPYDYGNGLWMNLEVVAFGTVKKGDNKTMKLKFTNDTDEDIQLSFQVKDGNPDIKFTSPGLVKAREEGVISITYQCTKTFSGMKKIPLNVIVNGKTVSKPLTVIAIGN